MQTRNKQNANKRRSVKLQQKIKFGRQVKGFATDCQNRRFSLRRKGQSGNPI